ncbi:MAG: hypothetical protein K940chlam7_01085 [Chlamydiae bacterium]|nr:hypothetical protein [Chlamydiota bacterium]
MRVKELLLWFFAFTNLFVSISEAQFFLASETISPNEVKSSSKYSLLDEFDPGHYKSLVKMYNVPQEQELVIKMKRKVLDITNYMERARFSREQVFVNGDAIGENVAMFTVSSRGFLPGEKCEIIVESQSGKSRSEPIVLTPLPVISKSKNSEASISAELALLYPTTYSISFEGFDPDEKLKITTISYDEKGSGELVFSKKNGFLFTPGVIGKEGGISKITIYRQNGEQISQYLPWGKDLIPYSKGEVKPLGS